MDKQLLNMAELIEPHFPEAARLLRLRACDTPEELDAEVNAQSQLEKLDEDRPAWLRHGEHFHPNPVCHLCASPKCRAQWGSSIEDCHVCDLPGGHISPCLCDCGEVRP